MSLINSRFSGRKFSFIQKKIFLFILGIFFLSILLICYFVVDPIGFRRYIFQPIREVKYFQKELEVLPNWRKIKKVTVPNGIKVIISSKHPNHLKIAAELRTPEGKEKAPAILLLHGSSPWGRREGLIQYLAFRLYKDGWITLAPDARGFGETDDPKEILNPLFWNVKNDVKTCIDYLSVLSRTDSKRIYVFGHSMGAGHALLGALDDKRVRALILVGPPRYVDGPWTAFWDRVRFSADRGLRKPISIEVAKANFQSLDLSNYVKGVMSMKGHKPIFLIDGEKEGRRNLDFLRQIVSRIIPPIKYQTLSNTGHYCGTYNFFGSKNIYIRPDMFNPFYNLLKSYFIEVEGNR